MNYLIQANKNILMATECLISGDTKNAKIFNDLAQICLVLHKSQIKSGVH